MIIFLLAIVLASEDSYKHIIGIDLGTTYSSVGVYRNGKIEIIPNEYGSKTTPSVVAIQNGEFLVGEDAKNQAILNPKNTFYDLKRLTGREYTDPSARLAMKKLTYDIVKDNNNNIRIQVSEFQGERPKNFSPEYIQAKIVSKMKKIAEDYLGFEVKNAIITVPITFNDLQKQATRDIGEIADLNVTQILSEPKSAVIAYGFDMKKGQKKNVFVIDFGGGTLDVTVINVEKYRYQDITHSGDSQLGGEDFDNNLVNYFLNKIKTTSQKDLRNDKNVIQKLKIQAQKVKEALSDQYVVDVAIMDLVEGFNFIYKITRAEFENQNKELFQRVEGIIRTAHEDSKLDMKEIDEILLVGGSSKIPRVQEIVKEYFDGIQIVNNRINDELICAGAVIKGAIKNELTPYYIYSVTEVVRTSISYGIQLFGEIMSVIIPKNTIYPKSLSQIYTTAQDYQNQVIISIFQGESNSTLDNTKIGEFILDKIQVALKGIPQIEVTFKLNQDGILIVQAVDLTTKSQQNTIIITNTMTTSKEDIQSQKENNKKEQEQQNEKRKLQMRRESTLISCQQSIEQYNEKFQSDKFKSKFSNNELEQIQKIIHTFSKWFEKNKENPNIQIDQFETKLSDFNSDIESILEKKQDL